MQTHVPPMARGLPAAILAATGLPAASALGTAADVPVPSRADASVIKWCSSARKNVCLLFHHPPEVHRKTISTSVVIMTG